MGDLIFPDNVQPDDVLPGDIDAGLGAPWIPATDIQALAADLFRVSPSSVPLAHLKKDAVWSLDAAYDAQMSVAATSEYDTTRANGTWLLELALNMKSPTVYDTIQNGDRDGARGGGLKLRSAWASFRELVSFHPAGQLHEARKGNESNTRYTEDIHIGHLRRLLAPSSIQPKPCCHLAHQDEPRTNQDCLTLSIR